MTDPIARRKKTTRITDLQAGTALNDLFVIRARHAVEAYAEGKKFRFELSVGDASGQLTLKYWGSYDREKVDHLHEQCAPGRIIHVSGKVGEWQNRLEITVNTEDTFHICAPDEYELRDFLPVSLRDPAEMQKEFRALVQSVSSTDLRAVLDAVFTEAFFARFKEAPAAVYKHHACVGGLLEHTLATARQVVQVAEQYRFLDKQLLITGALFHDIGKVRGFTVTTHIGRTKEGIMIGNELLSLEILDRALSTMEVDEDLALKLRHMIVSSLGRYSRQKPAFPEALVLAQAKRLDTQLAMMREALQDTKGRQDGTELFVYTKEFGNLLLE